MDVTPLDVTVEELVDGYKDMGEDGVFGYGGKLDIRPPFQREFVYKEKQRNAVIDTINKGYPLNVMYWGNRSDGRYEIIDGQQRTVSIALYCDGVYSIDGLFFDNLPADKQNQILSYVLKVYVCAGTESEKLEWFKTINIAGERLTDQEMRNAVYAGPWVSDAKRRFSKSNCPAYNIGQDYVKGSPIRQDYLETAIRWASGGDIDHHMAKHQHYDNAQDLFDHFENVIDWVKRTFTEHPPRSQMQAVNWGVLYDEYKDADLDPEDIKEETKRLFEDDEVRRKAGIYTYILTRDPKHLNLRAFSNALKRKVYDKQGGKCAQCGESFTIAQMEGDHITPWTEGGKTIEENCQMLCKEHNRRKGSR